MDNYAPSNPSRLSRHLVGPLRQRCADWVTRSASPAKCGADSTKPAGRASAMPTERYRDVAHRQ